MDSDNSVMITPSQKNNSFLIWVLVGGGVLFLLVIGGYLLMQQRVPPPPQPLQPSPQPSVAEVTSEAKVVIRSDGFYPTTLRVKRGTAVSWVNEDNAMHRIASDPHPTHTNLPSLDSGEPLRRGDSYNYLFDKPGTYTYHDHLNPMKFKGTIVVE